MGLCYKLVIEFDLQGLSSLPSALCLLPFLIGYIHIKLAHLGTQFGSSGIAEAKG
ncbi:hypothetical protein SAMN05660816_06200 [Niastella yeongjuensis]|nr:hypothetical protein SAMN05660816_06200 [Niastella yeongjuensis]